MPSNPAFSVYFYFLDTLPRLRGEQKLLRYLERSGGPVKRDELVKFVYGRISATNLVKFESLMKQIRKRLRDSSKTPALRDSAIRVRVVHSSKDDSYRLQAVRHTWESSKVAFMKERHHNPRTTNPIVSTTRISGSSISEKVIRRNIFLCHSAGDKSRIRNLRRRLLSQNFQTWLDEADLLPGQDWDVEIRKALRSCDVVMVCLSKSSVTKEGYVQKEIKFALDVADEKPEGTIYIIPVRLEECQVPSRLAKWHFVDLFKPDGFDKLCRAIRSKTQAS